MATIHPLFKENQTNDMQAESKQMGQSSMSIQPPVLALSANANMLEIVQRAAPNGSKVINVATLDAMMTQCRSLRPGVLLIDAACCPDIASTTIQLLQDQPELVVIVAGKSEDSAALMKLTAAGHIYRFLLMPLAHNQTKLTLEAAMTQHNELGASNTRRNANAEQDDEGGARKSYLPAYIGLGAALALVVGGAFYGLSRMGNSDQATVVAGQNDSGPASKELALADAALAAGKLLEPPGDSALDLYRSAMSINPRNPRAQAGINAVADKLLAKAEAALTAEQLEPAITALEQARDVAPDSPRLKFLDGQVARERERLKLTQAQDLGKKVRALLAAAQDDMDAGRLLAPAGNNARDSILDARKLDPTDPSIAQAQRSLSTRLIDAARRAAEQNQTEQAQSYLVAARSLGSAGAELSAVERSLTEARTKSTATEAQLAAAQKAAAAAQAERDVALAAAAAAQKAAEAAASAPATSANPAKSTAANASAATPTLPAVPLKRTKTVAPTYPDDAKKRGVSGWVEVSFLVTPTGAVDGVRVTNSEPKEVFDWAAVQAVEQWRFEPPLRDGKPTSQTTKVKLRFDSPK